MATGWHWHWGGGGGCFAARHHPAEQRQGQGQGQRQGQGQEQGQEQGQGQGQGQRQEQGQGQGQGVLMLTGALKSIRGLVNGELYVVWYARRKIFPHSLPPSFPYSLIHLPSWLPFAAAAECHA